MLFSRRKRTHCISLEKESTLPRVKQNYSMRSHVFVSQVISQHQKYSQAIDFYSKCRYALPVLLAEVFPKLKLPGFAHTGRYNFE